MKYYFAPMEGITLYPLRGIHREIFGEGVDKYFTPFLTASHTHHFKNREKKDILPERNSAFDDYPSQVQPQIMAGCSEDFLWAAKEIQKLGYNDVNLNIGCPASTVVNRRKGARLLLDPDYLENMLKEIFDQIGQLPAVSLKTRLGFSSEEEADRLMEIYARFPVKELIIHARVREDYYAGAPRTEAFKKAVKVYRDCGGKADICYNGDVSSKDGYMKLMEELGVEAFADTQPEGVGSGADMKGSEISSVMIGRGLLANPALVRELKGGEPLQAEELKTYLRRLYEEYAIYIPEDRNVIFKMLEHWAFLHEHFRDADKCLKNIRKSRSKDEYFAAVNMMFTKFDH